MLQKDEQLDGICWRCLVHGEWRNPTTPGWVWWLVVGPFVSTFPHFLSPGKCLGHNGDPVRRGQTLAIMGVGPFVGLTLSSKGVW